MIFIIDFGGQYTHLICKGVRKLGEYSELVSPKDALEIIKRRKPQGIILSGSPRGINEEEVITPSIQKLVQYCKEKGIGILGICYGHQLLSKIFGGQIREGGKCEYGKTVLKILGCSPLFRGLQSCELVWMSHRDEVVGIPPSAKLLGQTPRCKISALEFTPLILSVQFHPEVQHTPQGSTILNNFLDICQCEKAWVPEEMISGIVSDIKSRVGEDQVLIAVSGGIDSTVAAALCHQAIPDNLICLFVDHQLLRKGEAKEVCGLFRDTLHFKKFVPYTTPEFLDKLQGVKEPEEKRKIIGTTFMDIFSRVIADFYPHVRWVVQGTIYPDRIESGVGKAHKIKTHHNLVVPKNLGFGILEPLKDLYKDEVRELGKSLDIPLWVINRQPFPGPGLAIRIVGKITPEKVKMVREADFILQEEIKESKSYPRIWQSYVGLLSSKTVGLKGDSRCYGYTAVIRIVESENAMTARALKIEWRILEKVTSRITNEVPGITRVMLDLTSKPPGTIELE